MVVLRLLTAPVLILMATVSWAQGSGPIHSCVNSKNGKLRIVPSGTTCSKNESPLSWNTDPAPQLIGLTTATFTAACRQKLVTLIREGVYFFGENHLWYRVS